MELTTQERARIFAMYLGCALHVPEKPKEHWYPFDQNEGALTLAGVIGSSIYVNRIAEIKQDKFDQCALLLKPLSAISDEDAVEVAKIEYAIFAECGGEFIAYKMRGEMHVAIKHKDSVEKILRISVGELHNEALQYLRSKGYALPVFVALGHPCNGMDPIQIGVAIDATTLTTK